MGTRAKLARAQRDHSLVRIERSLKHADHIDGFIVDVGARWCIVQGTREGGYFDGYSAFRLQDVKKIHRRKHDFAEQFARTLPTWPPSSPQPFELDSAVSVIRGMGARNSLIGIEREGRRSAIWIGRLSAVAHKWTWLLEVRPDGSWREEPLGYKTKQITLVSIDSMYQRALTVVAGSAPGDDDHPAASSADR